MRSLIDILDLSVEEIDRLMDVAASIMESPESYYETMRHKKLATLFFEPSTRTRLSFEAAMYELGGNVLGFSEASTSSAAKGESISDTARIVAGYADVLVMRHPKEGAPLVASLSSPVPVINAGDGGHNHPTQTLADLFTIRHEKGRLSNLTVGFCGDLKYGRTVHSLIAALSRYTGIRFVLISPEELKIPSYVKRDILKESGADYIETTDFDASLPELDILYMTRIQRERFSDPSVYERVKDLYILGTEQLAHAKEDLCIMHPLPRVNEISVAVDADPRACYFRQALYGKYMRMALILFLLGKEQLSVPSPKCVADTVSLPLTDRYVCKNRRCITTTEQELPQLFKLSNEKEGVWRCVWCEHRNS